MGFEDTQGNVNKVSEDLERRGTIAIHYPEPGTDKALILYTTRLSQWDFFIPPGATNPNNQQTSLYIVVRNELPSLENLPDLPYPQRQLSQKELTLITSPYIPAIAPKKPKEKLPSGLFSSPKKDPRQVSANGESAAPLSMDSRQTQLSYDVASFDLEQLFRDQFSITYSELAAVNGDRGNDIARSFYLMLPSGTDAASKAEGEIVLLFLKDHDAKIFLSSKPGDWKQFVDQNYRGVVLLYADFSDTYKLESLGEVLKKPISFWSWSLSKSIDYFQPPTHFQRLFPHGAVILITEDFLVHEPNATIKTLTWLFQRNKTKNPGSWRIMFRPSILEWLLMKHDNEEQEKKDGS